MTDKRLIEVASPPPERMPLVAVHERTFATDALRDYSVMSESKNHTSYRDTLIALEQKSQAEYDRIVVALSGGALGISFAFVERFIGDDQPRVSWALLVAWIAWVCSLALVLGSHFSSTQAMRTAVAQVDDDKINTERVGGTYDRVLVCLNAFGGVTFLIGAFFAGVFVWYNLG